MNIIHRLLNRDIIAKNNKSTKNIPGLLFKIKIYFWIDLYNLCIKNRLKYCQFRVIWLFLNHPVIFYTNKEQKELNKGRDDG